MKPLQSRSPESARPEPRFDVELVSLTKRYEQTLAVDAISLRIPPASYCCLLGPSGCGKTSTLRMIAGHEHVSDGDILLRDRNITPRVDPQHLRVSSWHSHCFSTFRRLTLFRRSR